MQFIKNLFQDKTVIGLSGLRKKEEYLKITIPQKYRQTTFVNLNKNYILSL